MASHVQWKQCEIVCNNNGGNPGRFVLQMMKVWALACKAVCSTGDITCTHHGKFKQVKKYLCKCKNFTGGGHLLEEKILVTVYNNTT